MSSCSECHGAMGRNHTSSKCPKLEEVGENQTKEAKQSLYTALLEVIGDDEDAEYERKEFGEMSRIFAVKESRNQLRAEQRKALKQYFGVGDE